ncbi:MAG: glycosyl transferase group 1 [Hydrocarboniphaga sp.]|uniref:glycosyltransferase family 4 protein n=1 Tax=Hydrocarboniphaga sp. TaxID=2033016 RepID=UPI002626D6BA|nr:glycosyltransferase family 4 protein [Hydrocarboniphaga sp.]MDB5970494.1 glycosyl transferase group 1 [Hydrocarboniphaga sp.]
MKIVIPLINLSWHGGVRVLVRLANHLHAAGHDVELAVTRGYVTGRYFLSPGVDLKHVGVHTGFKPIDYLVFLGLIPFVVSPRSVVVANFFVTYFPARLGAWLRRGNLVYLVQDIETKYSGWSGRLLNLICTWTYRDRNIITANRHLQKRLLANFGAGSATVDIGPAEIFYELQAGHRGSPQYDVIFFARREPWKGLDRFYDLLSRGAPWRFICVSQDQALLDELRARGLECRCPGDDEELIRVIDSARLLLFTSYDEGFGLPPLEAMSRGIPTILYPSQGPRLYVVHEQNAIYVNNVVECQQRIEQLLTDGALYEQLSTAGRRTAEKFRMSVALVGMQKFIEDRSPIS